jgi:hypothetical protein
MYIDTECSYKVPFTRVGILEILNFLDLFSKNAEMSSTLKILPVRAELSIQMDGWTDMTKVIVACHYIAKALKNY